MKILKFLLATCLISSFNSFSQTSVSGGIYANTTWTLAQSPYIVSDDIVVFENVDLTIEPGVEIKFESNKGLELRGKMIAIGTTENRIVFTSNLSSPTIGSWNGIDVIGTTDPLGVGDQLTMKYVDGLYANYFVDLDLAYHGPYIFENCYFAYNDKVNKDSGLPFTEFDKCDFKHNNLGLDYFQFDGKVSHCNFIENVNGLNGVPIVDTCYFANNSGIALSPYGVTTGCKVVNNNIGVSCMFNAANHEFVNNEVSENVLGVVIGTYFNGSITFTGNTICDNSEYNIKLMTPNNADLSQNCWCTTDEPAIRTKIFDGYVDTDYGLVTFTPLGSNCPLSDLNVEETSASIEQTVHVYPNPFSDQISIRMEGNAPALITLFDLFGRIMFDLEFTNGTVIPTVDLSKGVYLYQIQSDNKVISSGKLIKE